MEKQSLELRDYHERTIKLTDIPYNIKILKELAGVSDSKSTATVPDLTPILAEYLILKV